MFGKEELRLLLLPTELMLPTAGFLNASAVRAANQFNGGEGGACVDIISPDGVLSLRVFGAEQFIAVGYAIVPEISVSGYGLIQWAAGLF